MATKKKGQLAASSEWAKHLRKFGRRLFWRKERRAETRDILTQRH